MTTYQPSLINTQDVIAWADMQAKHYYNVNQQPHFFDVSDKVLLQLHQGYKLPGIVNKKIEQQFVELFKVIKQIGQLTYQLELSAMWKIHNVILIAHLEPATSNDLY